MNKLLDLRFVIGLFFSVVGLLLIIYFLLDTKEGPAKVNAVCGGLFLLFGLGMILVSYKKE
jgi:hypothetical protein